MAVKFTNGIDLDRTAIQNALLHPVGSDPSTPADGQVWYRTDTDTLHCRANGVTETISFSSSGIGNIVEDLTPQLGGMLDVNGQALGDGTRELLTFVEDVAAVNHLQIENNATGSAPILRSTGDDVNVGMEFDTKGSAPFTFNGDIAVTGTVDGRDVATDGTKLDGIEAAADVTDAANVDAAGATMNSDTSLTGNGWFLDDDTMAANDATKTVSQQSLVAYVSSRITGLADFKGDYNAATNTPDLDVAPSGVQKGDFYRVSVAGNFFAVAVEVGDEIMAAQDNPTTAAHWSITNRNLDQATTSVAGISEFADESETIARTDGTRAVTPLGLASFPRKWTGLIGDGVTTAITVTHSLGTKAWTHSIRDVATDEFIFTDSKAPTTNTGLFTFAVAPATNSYAITIIG